MNWRALLTLLLLGGALLSGWAIWTHRAPPPPAATTDNRPDYVLEDFELIVLGGDGKESFTMRAPSLARRPGDKQMNLTTPAFSIPDGKGQYWQVSAKAGQVSADHQVLTLDGEVRVLGPEQDPRRIRMETERLTVFPQRQRAETTAVVTVQQPGSILRGRGFAVSLANKRYEFRSQVRSRYDFR